MKNRSLFKCLFTVLTCLASSLALPAQDVTKEFTNTALSDVIKELEHLTDYSFIYESEDLRAAPKVTADFSKASIVEVLSEIIRPPLKYDIKGNIVAITKDSGPSDDSVAGTETVVAGVVRDAVTGEPVIGAAVWVKDTPIGVVTDVDGKYEMSFEGNYGYISVSYLGYLDQEIAVSKGVQVIDIRLEPNENELDEAIAVGYGRQTRASIVGAIASVNPTEMKVPVSKISNSLAGRLSGVISVQRSGEPGQGSTFWIRGISTFGANSNPLVLVDGVERDLDLVDVEDIKEFSVLKDAAATAVYGVRGANGVILITTRSGEAGKPKVTVKVESGIVSPTKVPEMADAVQFCRMYNDAAGYEYYSPEYIGKVIDQSDPDLYPNVDWVNTIFKNISNNTRANVNVSGGNSTVKYYVSGGFYNENGLFKNDPMLNYNTGTYYRKFNFRANVDVKITRYTTLNVNLATTFEQKNQGGTNSGTIWGYALKTPSNMFPPVYSNGKYPGPGAQQGYNPYALLTQTGYRQNFYNNAQSLASLTHDFSWLTPGLTATVKASFDAQNTAYQNRTKTAEQWGNAYRDEQGVLQMSQLVQGSQTLDFSYGNGGWRSLYLEASANYLRSFGKHNVSGLLLYQQSQKNYIGNSATDSQAALPYRHQGLAFRATYNYASRYFIEFNAGYNGSENFSPGHRFGFFPSVAAGWMLSNEKFWQQVSGVIDEFKIKGSYGLVGNDQIGGNRRFIYLETINDGNSYMFGESVHNENSLIMGEWPNDQVGWEKARKLDVGVELSLFDKLKLQVDYFHEYRSGIFLERNSIPVYVGISSDPYVNMGKMRNQGWDASFQYDHTIGEVTLSAMGNFTFARNVILEQDEPAWTEPYMNRTGQARYQQFGYVSDGLFQSQEDIDSSPDQSFFGDIYPGDIKYKDLNMDGKIDELDQKAIGYTDIPEIVYGFGLSVLWKGFDVSVFFQGISHVNFSINSTMVRAFTASRPADSNVFSDIYGNYWTPENPDAKYPRLSTHEIQNNSVNSDFWMVDGSYLRLKNAEIGYTLPKKVTQKMKISNMRFYLSGTNLLTFSPFKLWDPDLQTGPDNYPNNMVVNLGVQLSF